MVAGDGGASSSHSLTANGTDPGQIYVGVLVKYVNFGKGWRHRLFVLKSGVLRYYKVFGPHGINAYTLLESLRQQGEVVKIGAEVEVAENKWKSRTRSQDASTPTATPAAGDIHLQVSTFRISDADYRKFYIHSGTTILRLKADTKDDRWAWMHALDSSKGTWDGLSPLQSSALNLYVGTDNKVKNEDNEFLEYLAEVKSRLVDKGASQLVQEYVEDLLVKQHQAYHKKSALEAEKMLNLLEIVREIENEKRELQTKLLVETRIQARRGAAPNESFTERSDLDSDSISDTEGDRDDAEAGGHSDDDEHFMDCVSTLPATLDGSERTSSSSSTKVTSIQGDPEWIAAEGPPPRRRDQMPTPAQYEKSYSLWSIIKECIGKDLTRVCLPVYFNEPISALQKSAEDLEYSELLDKAAEFPAGSVERLVYVACFAVSGYACTANRTSKPFNPLLGETYEFVCPEKGIRFISEKVVHHPTIMAAYCEGRKWRCMGDGELRSKFLGPSIQLRPVGIMHLTFSDGDEYTWHKVTTSINNLIVGKLNIDHGGVMHVRNLGNGLLAKMKFKQQGLLAFRGEAHQVVGTLEKGGQMMDKPSVEGKWDEKLTATWADGSQELIWKKNPPPKDPTRHNWTRWAMVLNELTPGLKERLAPTDCRLRPDQHYMEIGEYDKANAEKLRLEQKQRAARKAAEAGEPLNPRWFEKVPNGCEGETLTYRYKGGYWESRAEGKYDGCRDIFGVDNSMPESPVAASPRKKR